MIELNNIRLSLGLSWNEFYLCHLVYEKSGPDGVCPMSRNEISENFGISTRAIIDLVKKIEALGYLQNVSGKLKTTQKWATAVSEVQAFMGNGEETSLTPSKSPKSEETSGEETSPTDQKSEESSPAIHSIVKKLHHDDYTEGEETSLFENSEVKFLHRYTNDSQETSPSKPAEVKNLHRQNEEAAVLIQESEETSPEETSSGDLYILNNNINNISKGDSIEEKGCGEKQKSYELTFKDGVATCEVLRAACRHYHEEHPDKYPMSMYSQFIRHWSAPDKKGVPKWHKELTAKRGTWHLPGRLATWSENDLKFNSKTYNGKSTQRNTSTLRPTSIAEPSKRTGAGNVAHVDY